MLVMGRIVLKILDLLNLSCLLCLEFQRLGITRQLFQRLQGPVEEDALKSHFEKFIIIGQKQHCRRTQEVFCRLEDFEGWLLSTTSARASNLWSCSPL